MNKTLKYFRVTGMLHCQLPDDFPYYEDIRTLNFDLVDIYGASITPKELNDELQSISSQFEGDEIPNIRKIMVPDSVELEVDSASFEIAIEGTYAHCNENDLAYALDILASMIADAGGRVDYYGTATIEESTGYTLPPADSDPLYVSRQIEVDDSTEISFDDYTTDVRISQI